MCGCEYECVTESMGEDVEVFMSVEAYTCVCVCVYECECTCVSVGRGAVTSA